MLFFSIHHRILKKSTMVSTKILSSTTDFKIDNSSNFFLAPNLKDHVTLKTGVMAAEDLAFAITGINYIIKFFFFFFLIVKKKK